MFAISRTLSVRQEETAAKAPSYKCTFCRKVEGPLRYRLNLDTALWTLQWVDESSPTEPASGPGRLDLPAFAVSATFVKRGNSTPKLSPG